MFVIGVKAVRYNFNKLIFSNISDAIVDFFFFIILNMELSF